jgi:hypothetical protein
MTTRAARAVRDLPSALSAEQIKICAYQFNIRSSGETDIDIDEIDGKTVLLRSSSREVLERDFGLLVALARELGAAPAAGRARYTRAHTGGSPAQLEPSRPDDLFRSPAVLMADGRPALCGPAAALHDGLDGAFRELARRTGAEAIYAEPLWQREDLKGFGYGQASPSLFRVSHMSGDEPWFWQNAVCDNLWKYQDGLVLSGSPRAFTSRGACCRNEGRQHFAFEYMRVHACTCVYSPCAKW